MASVRWEWLAAAWTALILIMWQRNILGQADQDCLLWANGQLGKTQVEATNNKIPQSQQSEDPKVPPDGAIHCNHQSTKLVGNKKSWPVTASEIWFSLQFCWENPDALSLGQTVFCCCSSSLELTLPLLAPGTKPPNEKSTYLPKQKILSNRNNQKCLFTPQKNGSEVGWLAPEYSGNQDQAEFSYSPTSTLKLCCLSLPTQSSTKPKENGESLLLPVHTGAPSTLSQWVLPHCSSSREVQPQSSSTTTKRAKGTTPRPLPMPSSTQQTGNISLGWEQTRIFQFHNKNLYHGANLVE